MKKTLRNFLKFLLKKLKLKYELYKNINGEWTYFTYTKDDRDLYEGDTLNVSFEGEIRTYIIVHRVLLSNSSNVSLFLKVDTSKQPIKSDNIEANSIIHKFLNLFNRRK